MSKMRVVLALNRATPRRSGATSRRSREESIQRRDVEIKNLVGRKRGVYICTPMCASVRVKLCVYKIMQKNIKKCLFRASIRLSSNKVYLSTYIDPQGKWGC